MTLLFPIVAFLLVLACTVRSLGLGLVAVMAVGYFNGVIRANYLSPFTTFMFDFGLLGLYVGFFVARTRDSAGVWATPLGRWALALIVWPVMMVIVPINDYLVQLVALRATVWFLPAMLVASRLRVADLTMIARGLALLNLAALAAGVYVYQNGVESLYPDNAVTQIIYASKDVGGGSEYHRIPSTFLSAHAYGGTMMFSLPFLLGHLFGPRTGAVDRGLMAAGAVAAVGGILLCAARQPAATFVLCSLIVWTVTRFNLAVGALAVGIVAAAALYAGTDERFQRVQSLEDTGMVSDRVSGSANASFFDLMAQYPLGAGMGSSSGTSVPFFLADRAPEAVGLENEYCRILIDQGLVGLGLWLGFVVWMFRSPPRLRLNAPWGLGVMMMFALCLTNWATAFIGAGTLSSIPASVMMLVQMGVLYQADALTRTARP